MRHNAKLRRSRRSVVSSPGAIGRKAPKGPGGGVSYPASVGPDRASTRRMASSQALVVLARPGRALPVSLTGAADCAGGGGFLSVYTSLFTP